MRIDSITSEVIRAALEVPSELGPGLLANVYRVCLAHLLRLNGLEVVAERPVPISFHGIRLDTGFRLDLLVEEKVVVEAKAIRRVHPVHPAQLLSHMRLCDKRVGLLLNFHVRHMRHGIQRLVNRFDEGGSE